jgi:hypothetical protein
MGENHFLLKRADVFKKFKYIMVVEMERASDEVVDSWEGKMSYLKKFIEKSMAKMASKQAKNEKNIMAKFDSQNIEISRVHKTLGNLERKLEKILTPNSVDKSISIIR